MKIAVLSDIHGNDYALDVVLSIAGKMGVKKILVLGDFVGYYYNPEKVLKQLELWDCEYIQGNHERMLLKSLKNDDYRRKTKLKYGHGIELAIKKLNKRQVGFIETLPKKRMLSIDNISIQMCHGTPFDSDYYLYPDATYSVLTRCIQDKVDFVLMGHTHHRFVYADNGVKLINFGSVGQSRDVGGLADWGIIDTSNQVFQCFSTPYPVSKLVCDIDRYDSHLPYLKTVIYRNNISGP